MHLHENPFSFAILPSILRKNLANLPFTSDPALHLHKNPSFLLDSAFHPSQKLSNSSIYFRFCLTSSQKTFFPSRLPSFHKNLATLPFTSQRSQSFHLLHEKSAAKASFAVGFPKKGLFSFMVLFLLCFDLVNSVNLKVRYTILLKNF